MEMNQEVDSLLLAQFSSMATQDREVLISELQKVIGNQLNAEQCAFFLDMNNWNLQGAVCSYFELYPQDPPVVISLPRMGLLHSDGGGAEQRSSDPVPLRALTPSQPFTQTWTVMNTGLETWPPGCNVRFFSGTQMTSVDRYMVDALAPGGSTTVTASLVGPAQPGVYRGQWRMSTVTGTYFGELLWVSVHVSTDHGTSGSDAGEVMMSHASAMMASDSSMLTLAGSTPRADSPTAEMDDQSNAAASDQQRAFGMLPPAVTDVASLARLAHDTRPTSSSQPTPDADTDYTMETS